MSQSNEQGTTLGRLINKGEAPKPKRLGRQLRFHPHVVARWLRAVQVWATARLWISKGPLVPGVPAISFRYLP